MYFNCLNLVGGFDIFSCLNFLQFPWSILMLNFIIWSWHILMINFYHQFWHYVSSRIWVWSWDGFENAQFQDSVSGDMTETLPRAHVCIYIAHAHAHDTGDLGKLRNSTTYTYTQELQSSALLFCRLGKLSLDQWRYRSRLGNSSAVAVTVFCSLLFQWLLLPLFRSRFRRFTFLSSIGSECQFVFCPVGSSAWLSSALSSGS